MVNKAFAQNIINCPDGTTADASIGCVSTPGSLVNSETSLVELLIKISSGLLNVVIIVAIAFLIIGGIRYSLAAGDDEKIQKAKRTLWWSLAGLVLAIAARGLAEVILGLV